MQGSSLSVIPDSVHPGELEREAQATAPALRGIRLRDQHLRIDAPLGDDSNGCERGIQRAYRFPGLPRPVSAGPIRNRARERHFLARHDGMVGHAGAVFEGSAADGRLDGMMLVRPAVDDAGERRDHGAGVGHDRYVATLALVLYLIGRALAHEAVSMSGFELPLRRIVVSDRPGSLSWVISR